MPNSRISSRISCCTIRRDLVFLSAVATLAACKTADVSQMPQGGRPSMEDTVGKLAFAQRRKAVSAVPEKGVEPLSLLGRRILSPLRLPFRHSGNLSIVYAS